MLALYNTTRSYPLRQTLQIPFYSGGYENPPEFLNMSTFSIYKFYSGFFPRLAVILLKRMKKVTALWNHGIAGKISGVENKKDMDVYIRVEHHYIDLEYSFFGNNSATSETFLKVCFHETFIPKHFSFLVS
jgi:hypothetical protein